MHWRAALVCMVFAFSSAGANAAPKLVYRIDGATAKIAHGRLIVVAHGAVQSGGWTRPALFVRRAGGADTLDLDFAATPPRSVKTVVQATLPITARLDAPVPRGGALQVKLYSQTNSVVVAVTQQAQRAPADQAASATTRFRPLRLAR